MSNMSEETDAPQRLCILRGHTGPVTAVHAEWSASTLLSTSVVHALHSFIDEGSCDSVACWKEHSLMRHEVATS